MRRFRISRRQALRGTMAGLAVRVGLPALDVMVRPGRAGAQTAPKRMVVFFWGNGRGVDAGRWTPAATGASWTLSPQLAPLAPYKDYVNVVSGFDSKLGMSGYGHHTGSVAMMSGADYIEQDHMGANFRSTFKIPSIDQIAARDLGKSTLFRSLEIGISTKIDKGEGSTLICISHNGPDSGNPAEFSPTALYNRVFANVTGSAPAAVDKVALATIEMRRSVLDAALDDLKALQARVGQRDKVRLEQHAQNIRDIEGRLMAPTMTPTVTCGKPAAPTDPAGTTGREPLEERMQLMSRLLATAFACDLTRVATVLFSGSVGNTVFWQVNASGGHHNLSHMGGASQPTMDAATTFIMKQFGVLLGALKGTPEGSGNLLDQTALMATSDTSDGSNHSVGDMPIVVAGRAGGALRYPGIHQRGGGNNNTSRVLFTLLKSVGANITSVGAGGGMVNNGVSEIEA
jgi:hypothetical protein